MKSDKTYRTDNSEISFEDLKTILDKCNLLEVNDEEVADRSVEDIVQIYVELHVFDKPSFVEYTFSGSYLTKDEDGLEYYRLKGSKKVKLELSMQENQDLKKAIGRQRGIPLGYKMLLVHCNIYNQATLIATKGANLS